MKEKRYYHGGVPGLQKGDTLLPPSVTGNATLLPYSREIEPDGAQREDRVYITTELDAAEIFAFGFPYGTVYKVRPEEPIEQDPDCREPGISFQCKSAKIIAVINSNVRKLRK